MPTLCVRESWWLPEISPAREPAPRLCRIRRACSVGGGGGCSRRAGQYHSRLGARRHRVCLPVMGGDDWCGRAEHALASAAFAKFDQHPIDAVCGSGGGLESWGVWWCWWHVGPATLVPPSSRRKAGPAFVERPSIPVRQAATHAVFLCCFVLEKGRPLGTRTQSLPQYHTHNRTSTQYTPGISAPGGKPERILAGSDG